MLNVSHKAFRCYNCLIMTVISKIKIISIIFDAILLFGAGCSSDYAYQRSHFLLVPISSSISSTNNSLFIKNMNLTSAAFASNELIPSKYTCDGQDISPPLAISDIPEGAKSLVLIMDDPDAPIGIWNHWIVFNIPILTLAIAEGQNPQGVLGKSSGGKNAYEGPCPPDKEHRYFFKLYALDKMLNLPEGSTKAEVEKAMEGHILEQAELMGRYERQL